MNVLFLTLIGFETVYEPGLYQDLLREFIKNGHDIYAISPAERRTNIDTHLVRENHSTILRLRIGNTQKTNIVEKGVSTVMIEPTFKKAIRKFFSNVKFDLVLYSTPPITLVSAIEFVKRRDGARTYLLLKDIFPQNSVDLGILRTTGIKGVLYNHFRRMEKKLYSISDYIGCMSQANVDYIKRNNPEVNEGMIEVCPNSIEVRDKSVDDETRVSIRKQYGIPIDKKVFVYGGNLGKPQGIPFLIECLNACKHIKDAYFLIVGDGTEYSLLQDYLNSSNTSSNAQLMRRIPKDDYETMVGACDVGMIFLDYRFTIPNFPSRLLSYMQAKLPVLACTDINTDLGVIISDGGFGWWCPSNDSNRFSQCINSILSLDLKEFGMNGYSYLNDNYSVEQGYRIIQRRVN